MGIDYLLKGVSILMVQAFFQVQFANEKVLHNAQDKIFGPISTGGEVYSAGISVSIQL